MIKGNDLSISMEKMFKKLRANNPSITVLSEWTNEEFKEMVKKTFN